MANSSRRSSLLFILRFIVISWSFFWFNVSCDDTSNRKVSMKFNPGCNMTVCTSGVNGSFVNVAHVSAVGSQDSLHYVMSTIGKPTVLVARINNQLKDLSINWEKLLSKNISDLHNSVTFDPEPIYSFAVVFNRLIEYNDTHDDSTLAKAWSNSTKVHNFPEFKWSSAEKESNTTSQTIVFKTSPESSNFFENGSLSFSIRFFNRTGREDSLPHLLFNDNMTMFDFTIDHMKPSYTNSRFALEMIMVTSDKPDDKMTVITKKSLDDEYTPGIFKIVDWRSHPDQLGAYMQWKPVCYKKNVRTMADSTSTRMYDLQDVTTIPERSLASAYFGKELTERKIAMKANNISFGLTGDKFYIDTNYTSWTAGIGYGAPSDETMSILVIAIIGAGLGIPAVIMIIGGIIVCMKKRQGQTDSPQFHHGYTTINA
ncbi:glycosylated lysosomal membrane protein B-like [Lineus longissimus]|uniref:glycosylated lysosomal membrane protein B-like n=1 Tax=Lineus longissimus TaxID=88925 RepID=UPI00315D9DA2